MRTWHLPLTFDPGLPADKCSILKVGRTSVAPWNFFKNLDKTRSHIFTVIIPGL